MEEAQEQYDFRAVLDAVWEYLAGELELNPVLKELEKRNVFLQTELRDIQERHYRTEKIHAFLKGLRVGDYTRYVQFKRCLGASGQQHLVDRIEAAQKVECKAGRGKEPRTEEDKFLKDSPSKDRDGEIVEYILYEMNKPRTEEEELLEGQDTRKVKAVDDDEVLTPDEVLLQLGGCGLFQCLLCFLIQFMKIVVCWGMAGNSFFAYVPAWRCADYFLEENSTDGMTKYNAGNFTGALHDISTQKNYWNEKCVTSSGDKCTRFKYDGSIHTLVSEFDLVCDKSWVTASIISMQMIGMMVGHLVVGSLSDLFGRKKPFMASMAILCVFHVMGYFSVHWIMFAAARIVIGIGSAFFLSIYCILQGEYTLSKWRSAAISFPSWPIELCLFTLFAWLLHDWEHITLMIAIGSFVFLAAWFFIPESFRWLVAKDRSKDIKDIVKQVAKWNRKPEIDHERIIRAFSMLADGSGEKYSIWILFKNRDLLKLTVPLSVGWLTLGVVNYGIGFGIKKLSGNFFLNLFLFAIVSIPSKFITVYLQNKIGRRFTTALSCALCLTGGVVVGVVQHVDTSLKGELTNGFAILASAGVDGAWGPLQTLTVELYPTAARTTGFAFLSTLARLGAVLGPQFVYMEDFVPGLLYFVVAILSGLSIMCIFCLPETMNTTLVDKITRDIAKDRKIENVKV